MLKLKFGAPRNPDSGSKFALFRTRPRLLPLAALAFLGTTVLIAAATDDRTCIAAQQRILLDGPYSAVPDRAAFAAKRLCALHDGKPGPGYAQ